MTIAEKPEKQIPDLNLSLERDGFMRTLVRELANVLEDTVGLSQASGFISVVGQAVGRQLNTLYRTALETSSLTRDQVAVVLADLKQRIKGDFHVVQQDEDKIVLRSCSCPFADKVVGQKAMCMMTSNVFGHIAAENLGYAKVHLAKTIAEGDQECHVTVFLKPSQESDSFDGREYFKSIHNA